MKYKSGDKKTTAKRTDEVKLDKNNNIKWINLAITFEDINQKEDLIAVYLEHQKDENDNFKKVEIKNGKKKFHIIKLKDIKIFEDIELVLFLKRRVFLIQIRKRSKS